MARTCASMIGPHADRAIPYPQAVAGATQDFLQPPLGVNQFSSARRLTARRLAAHRRGDLPALLAHLPGPLPATRAVLSPGLAGHCGALRGLLRVAGRRCRA